MAPFLKFTVLRLALFLVALLTISWLGAGPLLAAVLAALVSMMLSYVLLRGPRDEMAAAVQDRIAGRLANGAEQQAPRTAGGRRRAEDDALEDDAVERIARQQSGDGADGAEGDARSDSR